MLENKPKEIEDNNFINNLYDVHSPSFNTTGREAIKLVTFSDLHIDFGYTEGSDNDCGRPLCCTKDSAPAPTKERSAGKWGDYKCDLNVLVFRDLLRYIKNDVKPDVILWGGDTMPHNVHNISPQ